MMIGTYQNHTWLNIHSSIGMSCCHPRWTMQKNFKKFQKISKKVHFWMTLPLAKNVCVIAWGFNYKSMRGALGERKGHSKMNFFWNFLKMFCKTLKSQKSMLFDDFRKKQTTVGDIFSNAWISRKNIIGCLEIQFHSYFLKPKFDPSVARATAFNTTSIWKN